MGPEDGRPGTGTSQRSTSQSEPKVPAGGTIDEVEPEPARLTIRIREVIFSPLPCGVRMTEIETAWEGGVMDRLNPLDAQFIDAEDEDRHTSMAIASIAVFEGPSPSYDEVLAYLAGRLPLVPRYRQKLRTVPLRLGRPVWVDDPHFDLRYHLRRTALPKPGGDEQLSQLMARVMSQRLDRDYPLWEYWLVEGLAHRRWALISKMHHCMVDGVSATDLYRVIYDTSPEPPPPAADELDRVRGAVPPLARRAGGNGHGPASGTGSLRAERRRDPSWPRGPAGDRHGAGHREAGPIDVAGDGVLAERADRPATAVHLGAGVAR